MSDEPTSPPSMSSAAGFPAKTSRLLDRVRASLARALASGPNTLASFANLDRATSSWKTSQHCLLEGLTSFSETWPRSGTMRGGIVCRLPASAPLTRETASSLWPTPNTIGFRSDGELRLLAKRAESRAEFDAMSDRACISKRERHWPTPTVGDSKSTRNSTANRKKIPPTGIHAGDTLTDAVTKWPTPTVAMHKGSSARAMTRASGASRENDRLDYAVEQGQIANGRLNADWVEWLMGFPIGWTSL